jgi:hypothetical protein
MSALLDPRDALRLAKICELFSSTVVGERAAAAERANAIVKARGLRWEQVLAVPPQPSALGAHFANVDFCLERADQLSEWEISFCRNLRFFRRPLSPKQQAVLDRLVAKCAA